MSLLKSSTSTIALLSLPLASHSWTVPPVLRPSSLSPRIRSFGGLPGSVLRRATPFFSPTEEFECPDEEECEINWDLMPGFGDDEDETDVDLQPRQHFGTQAAESLGKGRVHLEMNWQIEECETDKDSCAEFCLECAGSGKQACRFCRGTGIVTFGNEFRPCLICTKATVVGQEGCSSCRGTGKIAPWASTLEDHLKSEDKEEPQPRSFT